MYNKSELSNKLKILTHAMPDRQTVSLGIWIGTGGRYENKTNKGISHLIEHLVFKGSKKYSNRHIKESIEGVGGALNAFTSEEFTCYLAKVPAKHLHMTLSILSDMVINPLFRENDLSKEKTVIMEEIKMYKDLPQHYVNDLLDELLWPDHPLGMNIAGTIQSVGMTSRKDLFEYKKKFYSPSNIVIASCGNLNHQELANRVKSIYALKPAKGNLEFKRVSPVKKAPKVNACYKEIEQTHISLGMHAFKRDHPDRYALAILNIIMGANMSSRLFHEVREKRGLAYAIASHVRKFYDTGAFSIQAGVDNKNVFEAVTTILNELKKIKKSIVSDKELKYAKEYLIGQMHISLEDTLDYMLWIGEQATSGDRIYTPDEIIKSVNKVTKRDINRVANKIFRRDNINLALIGPNAAKYKKNIEKLIL